MLYLAIPAHNEAATIGVLLWRLRTVLAEFPREYEAVVYDDASTDSTSEILESYAKVMPLTVLRGERQVGYAGAVDALARHVARNTRYPRRDALLLLQGDFTDSPAMVPEFIKRFEGGMDLVVGERGRAVRRKAPTPVKRLLQVEPWLTRFLVRAEGIRDLTSSYRLIRISVLRDLLRTVGDAPICVGDARTANADLLMRIVPLARRVEALPVEPSWEVRLRETRVVAVPDTMTLLRWAWRSRGRRAVPSTAPEAADTPRGARNPRDGRTDLRLESRADALADASVVIESGRLSNSRDASGGRGRKPRSGRNAGKPESRNETRGEPRNDARAEFPGEPRTDSRTRPRASTRPGTRADAGLAPLQAAPAESEVRTALQPLPSTDVASGAFADDVSSTSPEAARLDRPPRRKRTRGGRRDRAGSTSDAESGELDAPDIASNPERGPSNSEVQLRHLESARPDADERPYVGEIEFSSALSDAVADVELELDGGGRTRPPRKKRRRRGSRGGRTDTGAPTDEDLADGSGGATDNESEGVTPTNGAADAGSADFAGGDSGSETTAEEGGDAAEARVRRRGRRGRRGGSRRSRSPKDADENSGGGEDFSAPPPSAPAPED